MNLLINMVIAVGIGLVSIVLFTGLVILTNKTISYTRSQVRFIRVWQLIRVVAALTICGLVGTVVMQAFGLWIT